MCGCFFWGSQVATRQTDGTRSILRSISLSRSSHILHSSAASESEIVRVRRLRKDLQSSLTPILLFCVCHVCHPTSVWQWGQLAGICWDGTCSDGFQYMFMRAGRYPALGENAKKSTTNRYLHTDPCSHSFLPRTNQTYHESWIIMNHNISYISDMAQAASGRLGEVPGDTWHQHGPFAKAPLSRQVSARWARWDSDASTNALKPCRHQRGTAVGVVGPKL